MALNACACEWRREDAKRMLLSCPQRRLGREEMLTRARTTDVQKILTTPGGIRAVTLWILRNNILPRFSLARGYQGEWDETYSSSYRGLMGTELGMNQSINQSMALNTVDILGPWMVLIAQRDIALFS